MVGDGVNVPEALNVHPDRIRLPWCICIVVERNAGVLGLDSHRSPRAWHVVRDMCETWEALAPPRMGRGMRSDEIGAEQTGIKSRESDRLIVV